MPLATFTERRKRLREMLESRKITIPGSVFDPTSARLAQAAGYEMGLLGGSVASAMVLGAPDIVLLTLSDFTEQVRRVTRASDIPLLADADHGYGNAMNVRRTVQDLEAAGVCAMSIEDTLLPRRFGGKDGELIDRDEFAGKLRAAVEARSDPALVIVGRTAGLTAGGVNELVERVKICAAGGVDAVFATGVKNFDEVKAIAAASDVPLLVNSLPVTEDELLDHRVRIVMQGHVPYYVALKALYDSFVFLRNGGTPEQLRKRALTPEEQAIALDEPGTKALIGEYLGS
jgi:carboxyvinyl-carboxyphosphonate phosphorylmutase